MEFKNVENNVDMVGTIETIRLLLITGGRLEKMYNRVSLVSGIVLSSFVCLLCCSFVSYVFLVPLAVIMVIVGRAIFMAGIPSAFKKSKFAYEMYKASCMQGVKEYLKGFDAITTIEEAKKFYDGLPSENDTIKELALWFNLDECKFFMGVDGESVLVQHSNGKEKVQLSDWPDEDITRDNVDDYKLVISPNGLLFVYPISEEV